MMVWFASGENLTLGTRLGGRLATLLSRSSPPRATVGLGHEDAFPPPRLSVGCRFNQRTFAGMRRNGRDAPLTAVRPTSETNGAAR